MPPILYETQELDTLLDSSLGRYESYLLGTYDFDGKNGKRDLFDGYRCPAISK